jgi:hypothetical protein
MIGTRRQKASTISDNDVAWSCSRKKDVETRLLRSLRVATMRARKICTLTPKELPALLPRSPEFGLEFARVEAR